MSLPSYIDGGLKKIQYHHLLNLGDLPKSQSRTQIFAAMQGADQHIRSSLGFSILSKDTSTHRPALVLCLFLPPYFDLQGQIWRVWFNCFYITTKNISQI